MLVYCSDAAIVGNAKAQFLMGNFFQYGFGVGQNAEKASDFYLQAATQGNVLAQYNVGREYLMQGNFKKAFEFHRLAADQGDSDAQNSLGDLYLYGLGTPMNHEKAIEYFRRALEQGDQRVEVQLRKIFKFSLVSENSSS